MSCVPSTNRVLRALATTLLLALLVPAAAHPQSRRDNLTTIQNLVPNSAVGFISLPSIATVQATLEMMHAELEEGGDPPQLLESVADQLGADPDAIDTQRPLAVAFAFHEPGGPPVPTAIVPVLREDPVFDLESSPFSAVRETDQGYVAISVLPDYAAGESFVALDAERLHDDLLLSLDLKTVFSLYGPWIQFYIANMMAEMEKEEQDPAAAELTRAGVDWLGRFMESAQRLDLGLALQSSGFSLKSTLHTRADGEPLIPVREPERIFDLARCLPKSYSAVSIVGADMHSLADLANMVNMANLSKPDETIPQELRETMLQLADSVAELQRFTAGPMISAVEMEQGGIESIQILLSEEAAAFIDVFERFLDSLEPLEAFGLTIEKQDPTSLEGTPVHNYRLGFDPEWIKVRREPDNDFPIRNLGEIKARLFGAETAALRLAVVDDVIVTVMHQDEAVMGEVLRRLRNGGGQVPENLRSLSSAHPVAPWLAADVDLRALIVPILEALIVEEVLDDPTAYRAFVEGGPVPLAISGSLQDGVYRGELRSNLRALADFMDAMKELDAEAKERRARQEEGYREG
ncbi:MAG: hypothetical protein JSW67_01140 [Candidatus Latescibacterota bacterium]|nr:MAG: hypothetical protein JSW67_01140 [Candidatus Latescibacterota bacterium]